MRLRKWIATASALLLLLGFAAWQVPARWILQLAQSGNPDLSWSSASGSAWDGSATNVYWKGLALGGVQWKMLGLEHPGELRTHWQIHGESRQYSLDGRISLTAGELRGISDLHARLPAAWLDLSHAMPFVYLTGTLDLDFDAIAFREGLPIRGTGTVRWLGAGLGGLVNEPLGDIGFVVRPPGDGAADVLLFTFDSLQYADIKVAGNGRLRGNDYEVSLRLTVSPKRPDLLELMSAMGEPGEDGMISLEWRGKFL
jgi:hypothetical protein